MVGFAALVTVLAGDDIWKQAGQGHRRRGQRHPRRDRRQGLVGPAGPGSRRSRRSSGAAGSRPAARTGGRAPGGRALRRLHTQHDALESADAHTTRHPRTPRLRARPGQRQLAGRSWSASSAVAGRAGAGAAVGGAAGHRARRRTWSRRSSGGAVPDCNHTSALDADVPDPSTCVVSERSGEAGVTVTVFSVKGGAKVTLITRRTADGKVYVTVQGGGEIGLEFGPPAGGEVSIDAGGAGSTTQGANAKGGVKVQSATARSRGPSPARTRPTSSRRSSPTRRATPRSTRTRSRASAGASSASARTARSPRRRSSDSRAERASSAMPRAARARCPARPRARSAPRSAGATTRAPIRRRSTSSSTPRATRAASCSRRSAGAGWAKPSSSSP